MDLFARSNIFACTDDEMIETDMNFFCGSGALAFSFALFNIPNPFCISSIAEPLAGLP